MFSVPFSRNAPTVTVLSSTSAMPPRATVKTPVADRLPAPMYKLRLTIISPAPVMSWRKMPSSATFSTPPAAMSTSFSVSSELVISAFADIVVLPMM